MDQSEMKKVFHAIRQRMSTVDAAGLRTSRKIEGLYVSERESQGFPNMLVFLDHGVGGFKDVIAEIMYGIDNFLHRYNSDERMRYLFSFGGCEKPLERRAHTSIRQMSLRQWQQWTGLMDAANVAQQVVITAFFAGQKYGSKPCPGKRDLLIFFARDRNISMPDEAVKQYTSLKCNALWFFLSESKVDWEIGTFAPIAKQEMIQIDECYV